MVTSQWFVVTDFRTSAECVLCLQDLSCLENLPSSLKIRIMQTRQTHSHPPTRMTVLLPMSARLPRRSWGVFHNERHPAGSEVKAHGLCVSVWGYFLLRRNVPLVSTPMLQAFTPLLAPPPHTERVSGTRWPTFGVCGRRFFLSSSNSNPLFSLGSFTYSLYTSTISSVTIFTFTLCLKAYFVFRPLFHTSRLLVTLFRPIF